MKKFVKALFFMLSDIAISVISVLLAITISAEFDYSETISSLGRLWQSLPFLILSAAVAFLICQSHRILWEFASARDMLRLSFSAFFTFILYGVVSVSFSSTRLPVSTYIIGCVIMLLTMMAFRVVVRYIIKHRSLKKKLNAGFDNKISGNLMIIGAGNAAGLLIHDIQNNFDTYKCKVACAIDDDPQKIGQTICGIKIVGDRNSIAQNVEKYDISTIVFAIPSLPKSERSDILDRCTQTGCSVKVLPSFTSYINGKVSASSVRNVSIEDLLGRDPINIDIEKIIGYVKDKTVLVTGGGGSIGSELCRQLAAHGPKKLIIFDIYENNAYDILNELKHNYPELDVIALIGSVRDRVRIESVFAEYRPEIVYHAAAHKHVPLMEDSPNEAVKNNVFGTFNTVKAADKYNTKRFVLISTDKAVNPTNVMGASKRICEMIVQTFNKHSDTEFVAVRFGNVLGSNGSVIPLFKRQIAEGGPVTVTHKDITRFFMTIPEAVSLVLQAGSLAKGGEIFVLDMGKPVKIVNLAENLIRLSGLKPYTDIKIEFTGLRPGEKLYEEILMNEEGLSKTENKLIYIGQPLDIDEDHFLSCLQKLHDNMADDSYDIRTLIHEIVPTYVLPQKETVQQ